MESIHYGSLVATAPDVEGTRVLFSVGEPEVPFYPRSALKPLQAVAMVRAGLDLPPNHLALAAGSHSGASVHRAGVFQILKMHGLTEADLENQFDLPYGDREREEWIRGGGLADRASHNCSGKHAAMAATCVVNGWPVRGYLRKDHPLQMLVTQTVRDLTEEEPATVTTDGCGTPLFALTLTGLSKAFGRLAAAGSDVNNASAPWKEAAETVASAMRAHPEMVGGEGRDVTQMMRLMPDVLAKDGFEGVQVVGLRDGRAIALKISDGGDRARIIAAVQALKALNVDVSLLAGMATNSVLGGGHSVGRLEPVNFFTLGGDRPKYLVQPG